MSKVVILVGSERTGGNTDLLAQAFAKGAGKHHDVEMISVAKYKVSPCIGCNTCFASEHHQCFQKDDMADIYVALYDADVVVIASPVYFYGISSQLKAIIDRLHNPVRNEFHIKKSALLLAGAATSPEVFGAIKLQYKLILDFFKLEDAGTVLAGGVTNPGDVEATSKLNEAYKLGLSLQ